MKRLNLFLLFFLAMLLFGGSVTSFAQDAQRPDPETAPPARPDAEQRPNLLAELGLTPDQIRQIRQINQERRPQMMEAQLRMRAANRDLDMAIYADVVNDDDVQTRLKEFHAAQSEVARLRFTSELAVRKVLTPDQLIRFRDLRRRFAESRENRQNRRPAQDGERQIRPIERLKRRFPNN